MSMIGDVKQSAPFVQRSVLEGKRKVTVFGASDSIAGDTAFEESVRLGSALARKGFCVVNGGYSGTMSGSAKGATEAGGECYGVVVSKVFVERHRNGGANRFLTGAIDTDTILERIALLASSDTFVVLPGHLGTLQEFVTVWTDANLSHCFGARPPRIFAWRKPWESVACTVATMLEMPNRTTLLEHIRYVDGVDDLIRQL